MTTGGRIRRVLAKRSSPFAKFEATKAGYESVDATDVSAAATQPKVSFRSSKGFSHLGNHSNKITSSNDRNHLLVKTTSVVVSSSPDSNTTGAANRGNRSDLKRSREVEVDSTRASDSHQDRTSNGFENDGNLKESKGTAANPAERRSKRQRKIVTKFENDDPAGVKALSSDVFVTTSSSSVAILNKSTKLFDLLLERNTEAYSRAPRTRKVTVAMSVVNQFNKRGGRFVERKYRKTIKIVPDRQILPWIMQALHSRANKAGDELVAAPELKRMDRSSSPETSSDSTNQIPRVGRLKPPPPTRAERSKLKPPPPGPTIPVPGRVLSAASSPKKKSVGSPVNRKKRKHSTSVSYVGNLIEEPNDNDVLLGKGAHITLYPGNLFFRELVRQYREAYNSTSCKNVKSSCITRIIQAVNTLDPPGRFIEVNDDGTLTEASYRRVYDKTSQALRDSKRVWTEENRLEVRDFRQQADYVGTKAAAEPRPPNKSQLAMTAKIPRKDVSKQSAHARLEKQKAAKKLVTIDLTNDFDVKNDEIPIPDKQSIISGTYTPPIPSVKKTTGSPAGWKRYAKYPMISGTPVKKPSKAALESACLPDLNELGPPRTLEQEEPIVMKPHVHDVLFGRGPGPAAHPGNARYRKIVWENKEAYAGMKKGPKSEFATDIISTIRNLDPPGRFLEYMGKDRRWEEAPMARIINKTCQALRETKWSDHTFETLEEDPVLDEIAVESPSASPHRSIKHRMISSTKVKLPSRSELDSIGLPHPYHLGAPRLTSQEGPPIKTPHEHDVVFGLGPLPANQVGNLLYRQIVCKNMDTFSNLNRKEKSSFATDVINCIRNLDPPGRFLVYNEKTKRYEEATMPCVLNKTTETLGSLTWMVKTFDTLDLSTDSLKPVPQPNAVEPVAKPLSAGPRKQYLKHPMISDTPLKLPTAAELVGYGLPNGDDVGPPRLKSQENPKIKMPHSHDVLFGRGPGPAAHPGNLRFRRIVWENKKTYAAMTRSEKGDFASDIINTIRNLDPPGRFLEYDDKKKVYEEAPMPRVINKTLQALRESPRWADPPEDTPDSPPSSSKIQPSLRRTSLVTSCTSSMRSSRKRRSLDETTGSSKKRHSLDTGTADGDETSSRTEPDNLLVPAAEAPDPNSWPPGDDIYDPEVEKKVKVWAKITVYWPLDNAHYVGRVLDKQRNDVLLRYDEDDLVEWVDLTRHSFRVLDESEA